MSEKYVLRRIRTESEQRGLVNRAPCGKRDEPSSWKVLRQCCKIKTLMLATKKKLIHPGQQFKNNLSAKDGRRALKSAHKVEVLGASAGVHEENLTGQQLAYTSSKFNHLPGRFHHQLALDLLAVRE